MLWNVIIFYNVKNSRITQRTINHRHSFLDLAKLDQVNKVPTGFLIIISRVLIVKESSKLDAEKENRKANAKMIKYDPPPLKSLHSSLEGQS